MKFWRSRWVSFAPKTSPDVFMGYASGRSGLTRLLACTIGSYLLFFPIIAEAKPLVADLSAYRVNITSDFRGTRLFLFGARGATGQVVVAVRGPNADYLVQKKERVLGMWLVRKQVRFENVPQYYTLYSSAPLDFITSPELRRALGLGSQFIPMPVARNPDELSAEVVDEFRAQFRSRQQGQMLYSDQSIPVRFIGETLFKSDILFPDSIRPGEYIADVYLVDGSGVAASQSIPIHVRKRGLEAFVSRAATEWPLTYGICAVLIAAISGWGAHRLFRRI